MNRTHLGRRLALLFLGVAILVGCVDSGHSIVADNTTDTNVFARLTGVAYSGDTPQPFGYVVIVPARTRLAIAVQPFAGDQIVTIELLTTDCAPIATFVSTATGSVFVIRNGPTAERLREWPAGSPTARRTDLCPGSLPPPLATGPGLPSGAASPASPSR